MPGLTLSPGEWLAGAWDRILGRSIAEEPDQEEQRDRSEEWWYGDPPPLRWPRPTPIRMAPMAEEGPAIRVRVFHEGERDAAAVVAAYAEFAIRDAWGDSYRVEVDVHDEAVPVDSSDEFFGWVTDHPQATVKDCNLLVGAQGVDGQGGGETATVGYAEDIARLYGETLMETGTSEAHQRAAIALHEIAHCLGLSHRHGRVEDGCVTPAAASYDSPGCWRFTFSAPAQRRGPEVQ